MGLNLMYIASAPGIAKAVAIVLGFIAVVAGTSAMSKAEYIQGNGVFGILPEDNCKEFRTALKTDNWCPEGKMTKAGISIMWIVVIVAAIELIILLLVEIKSGLFNTIDCILMAVAGLCFMVAGGMCLYFAVDAYKNIACDSGGTYVQDICKDLREKAFQPLPFAICGGIGILTGIVFCGAGGAAKAQKS